MVTSDVNYDMMASNRIFVEEEIIGIYVLVRYQVTY